MHAAISNTPHSCTLWHDGIQGRSSSSLPPAYPQCSHQHTAPGGARRWLHPRRLQPVSHWRLPHSQPPSAAAVPAAPPCRCQRSPWRGRHRCCCACHQTALCLLRCRWWQAGVALGGCPAWRRGGPGAGAAPQAWGICSDPVKIHLSIQQRLGGYKGILICL